MLGVHLFSFILGTLFGWLLLPRVIHMFSRG